MMCLYVVRSVWQLHRDVIGTEGYLVRPILFWFTTKAHIASRWLVVPCTGRAARPDRAGQAVKF